MNVRYESDSRDPFLRIELSLTDVLARAKDLGIDLTRQQAIIVLTAIEYRLSLEMDIGQEIIDSHIYEVESISLENHKGKTTCTE